MGEGPKNNVNALKTVNKNDEENHQENKNNHH